MKIIMTKEDKELLLKDLSARLSYGVKILHEGWNYEWDQELSLLERVVGIDDKFIYTKVIDTHTGDEYRDDKHPIDTFDDKPYLRPMSSMTEEELEELKSKCTHTETEEDWEGVRSDVWGIQILDKYDTRRWDNPIWPSTINVDAIDWLNSHHFDYRGLIEKGLAIEVTKENNPYEN